MLTHDEQIEILEEIARDASNQAARIAAIRMLREIDAGVKPSQAGFDELDRIRTRRARA